MPAAPGDFSGKWFLLASPTGSGLAEFHNVITSSNWSSSAKLQQVQAGGPFPSPWGTSGNYPTNSRFLPTFYVKNLESVAYTQDYYEYIDGNTDSGVLSVPQNTQLVSDLGIITGSLSTGYGGKLQFTGSSFDGTTYNQTGSIQFIGAFPSPTATPFALVTSMSIAPNSFNRVNFSNFLRNLSPNTSGSDYLFIYRELESPFGECVFNVLSFDANSNNFGSPPIFNVSRSGSTVSNATFNISSSITFINKNQPQKTFILVGAANPRGDQLYANQFTVGTVGGAGDYRSGIIKIFVTESNDTANWTKLIQIVTSDTNINNIFSNPYYYGINHNLIAFTGSAGISSSYYLQMPDAPA